MKMRMMSRDLLVHKLKALAVSLSVFAFFGGMLFLVNYGVLYPDFLFELDGGLQGLQLVLAVDLVLGPVLAFIIYNHEKPRREQLMDIGLVAIIQFSAMLWGSYQVWSQRPVAVIFGDGRFVSLTVDSLSPQEKTPEDLSVFSDREPPFIYRREPEGNDERGRMAYMMLKRFIHLEAQVWLFEPFDANHDKVFVASNAVQAWLESSAKDQWAAWRQQNESVLPERCRFAFFQGRYADGVLIFNAEGLYLGYVRLPGKMPAIDKTGAPRPQSTKRIDKSMAFTSLVSAPIEI
jgi:hypothetical protein